MFRVLFVSLLMASVLSAQNASEIKSQTGIKFGLVVHIGTSNGSLEADFASMGNYLVHGLANDDAVRDQARDEIFSQGLYGMATVQTFPESSILPYADNLVNLIIADLTDPAFASIEEQDIQRVLAPGGVAYLKQGGSWSASSPKPKPTETGEWRQFRYDATNNPVSPDTKVKPATTLQWLDDYSKGVHMSTAGIVVAGDGAVAYYNRLGFRDRDRNKVREYTVVLRDAYNGLRRWNRTVGIGSSMRNFVIMGDRKVITNFYSEKNFDPTEERDGFARVLDFETGETIRVLSNGNSDMNSFERDRDQNLPGSEKSMVLHDGILYEASGSLLTAVNVNNNQRLWSYEADVGALFPVISNDGEYIYIAEVQRSPIGFSRWPWARLNAITCLKTSDGTKVWSNNEVKDIITTYLVYHEGNILFHGNAGIAAYYHGHREDSNDPNGTQVGVLDKDGNLLWKDDFRSSSDGNTHSIQGSFIRDGKVHLNNSKVLQMYDLLTGGNETEWQTKVKNQRCERVTATTNYAMMGFGTYLDKSGSYVDQNISRSGCASGVIPAYGMSYRANNSCWCFAQIRGFSAMSSEPIREPVPDENRLIPGNGYSKDWTSVTLPQPESNEISEEGHRLPLYIDNTIKQSWFNNSDLPYPQTESVSDQNITLSAVVNQHVIEARSGGQVKWRFVTDGRLSIPPFVSDGKVYAGAHDGQVYCLNLQNGELLWKYLAAPSHRWIVAYGQIESAWPVMGLVVHNGEVNFSAGRHPEVDYGISLGGLDPETGEQIWRGAIYHPTSTTWRQIGEDNFEKHVNFIQNPYLKSDGDKLLLITRELVAAGAPKGSERAFEVDSETIKPVALNHSNAKASFAQPAISLDNRGLTVLFPQNQGSGAKITLYNLLGNRVQSLTLQSGNKVVLPLTGLQPGGYLVRVETKGVFTAKFLVR